MVKTCFNRSAWVKGLHSEPEGSWFKLIKRLLVTFGSKLQHVRLPSSERGCLGIRDLELALRQADE